MVLMQMHVVHTQRAESMDVPTNRLLLASLFLFSHTSSSLSNTAAASPPLSSSSLSYFRREGWVIKMCVKYLLSNCELQKKHALNNMNYFF